MGLSNQADVELDMIIKSISFRCLIRLLGISSHWDNWALIYHSLRISHHLTPTSLLEAVFPYCYIVVFIV